jgi:uncharacterized protein (DUF488 family)
MTRSFYTIGYEGARVDAFVATLQRAGVETLIDVRDVPLSPQARILQVGPGRKS